MMTTTYDDDDDNNDDDQMKYTHTMYLQVHITYLDPQNQ